MLHPFSNRSLPYDCFATLRNLYKQAGTPAHPDKESILKSYIEFM